MNVVWGTNKTEILNAADGVTGGADLVLGLDGNDDLYGLGGDDMLKGGGGADDLYGGAGSDTADYSDSAVGVRIDLYYGTAKDGSAEGDTLYSIENLNGSQYGDMLLGDDGANTFIGLGGYDKLYGRDGDDTLDGGDGADALHGGAGADHLIGGDGGDTAYYADSNTGVTVSLQHHFAHDGYAEGDTLEGIEHLFGSIYDDSLLGDDNFNSLEGYEGNDYLKGYGGDDNLHGGKGNDYLIGGTGRDWMSGGTQADTFVWTSTSDTGIASGLDGVVDFNFAEGDRLDFSGIDADVYAAGNQAFTFIGTAGFSGTPGEINYYHSGGDTYIQMQTGTSTDVEGVIVLLGIHTPQASWFVL